MKSTAYLYALVDPQTAVVTSLRILGDANPTGKAGPGAPVVALVGQQSAETFAEACQNLATLVQAMPNLAALWEKVGEKNPGTPSLPIAAREADLRLHVWEDDLEAFIFQVAGHRFSVGWDVTPKLINGRPTDEEIALWAGFKQVGKGIHLEAILQNLAAEGLIGKGTYYLRTRPPAHKTPRPSDSLDIG